MRMWTDAAARGLALRSGERRHQAHGDKVLWAAAEKEEPGALDRKDPWHGQPRCLNDETSGWKTFGDVFCFAEHQTHQRSTKLTMDTEYLSRASRALAAMTLVRQAAANEVTVHSGAEHETWIAEHRIKYCALAGWTNVVIMTCCILMGLVLLWWKSGRIAETIETQTLEEGRCSQDVPTRIMVTRHGKAAHCRSDCPFSS